jgi:cell division protein FtsQ
MPSEEQLDEIVQLVEGLNEDGFMSKEVTQISLENNQKDYQLRLKTFDFKVILGGSDQLEEKIKKLKVFCAYQKVQDSLTGYPSINLKFKNQVVALRP